MDMDDLVNDALTTFQERADDLGLSDEVPEDGEWHLVNFNQSIQARKNRPVTHEQLEMDIAGFQLQVRALCPPTRAQIQRELSSWDFSPPPKDCLDFAVISACNFRIMSYRDRLAELISVVRPLDSITQDAHKNITETAMALSSGIVAERKANALQQTRSIERAAQHTKGMLMMLMEKETCLKLLLDTMNNSLRYLESINRNSRWQIEGQSHYYNSVGVGGAMQENDNPAPVYARALDTRPQGHYQGGGASSSMRVRKAHPQ